MSIARTPRPYQTKAITDLQAAARIHHRVLFQLPTGAGKTFIGTTLARNAAAKGKRVVFLVHKVELLRQTSDTFSDEGIEHGMIQAGKPTPDAQIMVAMVQTLARRLDKIQAPDLIFVDECHHCVAGTWAKVMNTWPNAYIIGLTATPERLDGKGLGDIFGSMVNGPSVATLIEGGFLSKYRAFAPSTVDMSSVKTSMGDYAHNAVADVMDRPSITGDIVATYQKLAAGKRTILFAVGVQHSRHLAEAFNAAGISATHLDGETPIPERAAAVAAFAAGAIKVLCNVELFGEGFDVPGIEAVILARPTQSLGLHLQQIGRALRPAPGKDHALILDHAGNIVRHGLPDDPREWNLDAKKRTKKAADAGPAIKQCPSCFAVHRPAPTCPSCNHEYNHTARKLKTVAGELREITTATAKTRQDRQRAQAQARGLDDLVKFGIAHGMRNPQGWARHVYAARVARGETV